MSDNAIIKSWGERPCVLATMHGKEQVIAPPMREAFGMEVIVPADFNTDQFGTFTREVKRVGDQLEAARAKARAALTHTGATLALASEGSFGPHPTLPFIQSNLEIVILIDTLNDLEIVGHYQGSATFVHGAYAHTAAEAVTLATTWGFPSQGVIVRRAPDAYSDIHKDIATFEELEAISKKLLRGLFTKKIYLETDLRAHRCPPRMDAIKQATLALIDNCRKMCPACDTPGFIVTQTTPGLPCGACGRPTTLPHKHCATCTRCHHTVCTTVSPPADPSACEWCNP